MWEANDRRASDGRITNSDLESLELEANLTADLLGCGRRMDGRGRSDYG